MAINIQDNFKVNIALPIDSRIVAANDTARLAIVFKYDGLRVFQTDNRKTFVWNATTSSWSESDISGSGLSTTLSKWTSSGTGLTSSGVYFVSGSGLNVGKVGINVSDPKAVLHLKGDGGADDLVAHSASDGILLAQNYWYNGVTDQYFDFTRGSSGVKFSSAGHILFFTRSNNTSPMTPSVEASAAIKIDGGIPYIFTNRTIVMYNPPGTSQAQGSLLLRAYQGYSSKTNPDISWWYNDQTGFFHPAVDVIGVSLGGEQFARFTKTGLLLSTDVSVASGVPGHKIQADSGNGVASFIQFTQGTTTGVTSARGVIFGITTVGSAGIFSRFNGTQRPIVFGFENNAVYHRLNKNRFTMYSSSSGVGQSDANADLIGTRVERGTAQKVWDNTSIQEIASIYIPNNSHVSLEVTFLLSCNQTATPSIKTFRSIKYFLQYTTNSSGVFQAHNNYGGSSGSSANNFEVASLVSSVSVGFVTSLSSLFNFATANTIKLTSQLQAGYQSGISLVSWTAAISPGRGH